MLGRTELVAASHSLDERTSVTAFDSVVLGLGVDPRALRYVADLRALRQALVYEGWSPAEINLMGEQLRPERMRLDSSVEVFLPAFTAVFEDGVLIGRMSLEGEICRP